MASIGQSCAGVFLVVWGYHVVPFHPHSVFGTHTACLFGASKLKWGCSKVEYLQVNGKVFCDLRVRILDIEIAKEKGKKAEVELILYGSCSA